MCHHPATDTGTLCASVLSLTGLSRKWEGREVTGLRAQQKVFINHYISTACFRIILLEHIQERDIWKKRQQQVSVMQMPMLKVLHWIQVQVQRQSFPEPGAIPENDTLHCEHRPFARFRTLNKPLSHSKSVRHIEV